MFRGMSTSANPHIDLRAEFPIKEQYAFFNHAGVAPIPLSTQMAISEFARDAAEEGPANYAAWIHGMSVARGFAGQLLNCSPEDVCFVKNTTHGILIAANSINWKAGDNVVGLAHEFPANVHPWKNLGARGVEFRMVPEEADYTFSLERILSHIDSRTRVLAVSWVEYGTGVRNDIEQLGRICRERGIYFCIDAIQGLGVLPLDLASQHADFVVADGHKWLIGPEGCGIMYVRRDIIPELNDSMCGWCGLRNPQDYDNYDQPLKPTAKRFEEGSHNIMSIIALGTSIKLLLDLGNPFIAARVRDLTERLIAGAERKGYAIVTPRPWDGRAGIVSITREGVDPRQVMVDLQEKHKILVAARRGFLRVSPHFYNDEEEIDRLLAALP
jgi:cysteine desulfurase / selenocysteine lyase